MKSSATKKVDRASDTFSKIYGGCGLLVVNLLILGFLCWGIYKGVVGVMVEINGEVTEGSVIRLEPRDGGTFRAKFEFEVNGVTYTFDDDSSSNPPKYGLGETVTIRYDRNDPNRASIDSVFPLWLFPSCTTAGLIIALVVVNFFGIRAVKRGDEIIDFI